ncbi:MAG: PAS domain S-box protein [Acidobacteriota bacterium]|nr:PAS domain S-box protein [Acidobacteriota bacterium]
MMSTRTVPVEIHPAPEHFNGTGTAPDSTLLRELQALRRSEAVLRDFIETSTISLHWVGADGTILWANQAELELLGYSKDQYVGRNIVEFHADIPVINEILTCLSRGETLSDYPARLRHRDGSIRHVLINSSVLFEDGKFVHTRCFTRDVTALRQEQELRKEQGRVDLFAARIGKHIIESGTLSDMLRNCTEAMTEELGAAFARIWTFNEEDSVLELQASSGLYTHIDGAHARIPVGSFKIGRIAAQRKPHLTNQVIGDPSVPEQEWARKEGMVAFAGYPLIVDGRLVGVIGMFSRETLSDVTLQAMARVADQIAVGIERKRAEEALRESQARLAAELADTKLLQDISAQLIEPGDEDTLYAKIVDAIAAIMRSDFATMQVLYPDRGPKGELRLLASRGLTPEGEKVWEWVRFDTESTCGQVLRTGKRAIATDVETCDFLAGTAGMAALLDAGIRAAQSTPLFSRSGKLLGMISSHWRQPHAPTERDLRLLDILARQASDLIERRQAEEALRESGRRLHELIEAIPAAVYTTDADGRITFFNQAAVDFSGRVPELGTDSWCVTWKLYNTDGTPLPHDQCPMAVALREKRPVFGCEAVAERPDGKRRVFTPYPTPLFDGEGRLTGAVNMLVDITERKGAEDILRESEERFRAIVATTPECVKVVAADGRLLLMNEAGLEMVGAAAAEDVIGGSVYDLIAPQDREMFRRFNERVCGGQKGSCEFDIVGLKGRRCRMETHAVPLRRPDGSIVQLGITRDITERRKAEETRLLLGAIVDTSDDAIISKDLGGQITSWNRGAERLYGYTAAEAVGKSIMIVVPPDRQEEEREILARLQRGERVDHFETLRRRKDGGLLNVSLTISPLRNQQGEVIGVSKIARDITEQKRAEEAIRKLNARLTEDLAAMTRMQQLSTRLIQVGGFSELLAEILDAGIEITDADMGNIQLLDDGGQLRIVAHRGFNQVFLEFFDEVHDGLAACGSALQKRERVIVEDVASSPVFAGSPARDAMLAAEARAVQSTPLVSRSGKVLGMFSTHYRRSRRPTERELQLLDLLGRQAADLIERKRGEEGRSQLSAIVEASGDAIYVYDFEGRIRTWNRAAEELFGYRADEITGRSSDTIVPPERRAELPEIINAAGNASDIIRNLETVRMRRDGSVFPALLTISPIHDESGTAVGLSVIARDITERKRAENELRRANQDLEQFAYSASHDLQEPLRTIKIYSELLGDHLSAAVEGETAEFLEFLRNAATRMEMLVRDLLAYTQVTRLEAPMDEVDANEAVVEVIANLGGAIAESSANVTCDKLPSIRVHRTHVRQLLQNLIGNAVKYRSEDRAPEVHIGAERRDGHWVFTVRDNGIGIQPEFKEQIFGLFARLHNADRYDGTGIGLAICQRIVERYHGRIWVESEPGRGSEFRFTLPL